MSPTWLQRTRSPVLQGRAGHRVARGEGITASVRLILASGARRALSVCWTVVVFAVGLLLPHEELGECGLRFWAAMCWFLVVLVPRSGGMPAAVGPLGVFGAESTSAGRRTTCRRAGAWLREGAGDSAVRRPRDGMSPQLLAG